jgi:hypothetical protein
MARIKVIISLLLLCPVLCLAQYSGSGISGGFGKDFSGSGNSGYAAVYYATIGSVAPASWVIPEYASSVTYLKMATSATSTNDSSPIGTNVVYHLGGASQPTYLESSNGISGCHSFDGGDYLVMTNTPYNSVTGLSISTWVKVRTHVAYAGVVYHTSSLNPSTGFDMWGSAGELSCYLNDNGAVKVNAFQQRTWNLFTMTWTSNSIAKMYVNGRQVTNTASVSASFLNNRPTYLGSDMAVSNRKLIGEIGETIIWTNSLTSAQVLDIYTNTYSAHGWSNSLALSSPSLYSRLSYEGCWDYDYPADLKGTNHFPYPADATQPAWDADGTNGWLRSDGSSDYLRYAATFIPASSTNYAMSCSFKPTVTNVARQVLMTVNSANTNSCINIELQLNKLVFVTHAGGFTNVIGTTIVNTTAWHKATVVCQNTTGTLYYDGASEGSGTIGTVGSLSRSETMAINGSLYYSGLMDNVRFYTNSLSASEVSGL